jgi:hypothetical protein
MKHANKFHSVRWLCLLVLLFGLAGAITLQAEEDMWIVPGADTCGADTWIGRGLIGSPVDPTLVPIRFQGEILLVPPSEIAGYVQKGGKTGWPEVVVPLLVDGKPSAVPSWQVADKLKKGAQTSDDLVILHKGNDQIAVLKSQVDECKSKGYELAARDGWVSGVVMCFKNRLVIVDSNAVAKYKKEGAEPGPCKK